jgi:hypothetical protein
MSSAVLGAIVGGLLGLGGSLGTLIAQDLLKARGQIISDVGPWKMARQGEAMTMKEVEINNPKFIPPEVRGVNYSVALRMLNEKGVSVGLLDLYVELWQGAQRLVRLRPRARLQYMEVESYKHQEPFEAATLPAEQVVVIWLTGNFVDEGLDMLRKCDKVRLTGRLSNRTSINKLLANYAASASIH